MSSSDRTDSRGATSQVPTASCARSTSTTSVDTGPGARPWATPRPFRVSRTGTVSTRTGTPGARSATPRWAIGPVRTPHVRGCNSPVGMTVAGSLQPIRWPLLGDPHAWFLRFPPSCLRAHPLQRGLGRINRCSIANVPSVNTSIRRRGWLRCAPAPAPPSAAARPSPTCGSSASPRRGAVTPAPTTSR